MVDRYDAGSADEMRKSCCARLAARASLPGKGCRQPRRDPGARPLHSGIEPNLENLEALARCCYQTTRTDTSKLKTPQVRRS